MPRATCRCGHSLTVPADGPERVICPKCAAKVRVRRPPKAATDPEPDDGFLRFNCPCGRRLKVKAGAAAQAGQCPDCGRVVPVPPSSSTNPELPTAHPGARTEELSPADLSMLETWARSRLKGSPPPAPAGTAPSPASSPSAVLSPSAVKSEAGLRVCPRCKRPVHLGAIVCRECGTHVPKR